jgi:ABC-2 type transport system permease protein
VAGLTPQDRRQFRELLALRRRMSFRMIRRQPGELAATILIFIFVLPIPVALAFLSGAAYLTAPDPWPTRLLFITVNVLWLIWMLLPVLFSPFNDATDLRRLITYPIRPGVLTPALLVGSLFDIATVFSAPFLLAILVGWARGPAFLLVVVSVVLVFLHMVLFSQLVSTTLAGVLRSRRFRDVLFITGTTLMLIVWSAQFWARRLTGGLDRVRESGAFDGAAIMEILRWTPTGACAEAITRIHGGNLAGSIPFLGLSAGILAVFSFVWWRVLVRVTTRGGVLFALPDKKTASERRPSFGFRPLNWLPGQIRELVTKELVMTWRTPRQRMRLLQSILMPAVLVYFLIFRDATAGELWWLGPPAFAAFACMVFYQNAVGNEGAGLMTLLLSPVPRYKLFLAKEISFGLYIAGPLLLVAGAGLWITRDAMVVAGLAAALALCGGIMLAANLVSVVLPVRLPDDGSRGSKSGQTSLATGLASGLGVPLAAVLVSSPATALFLAAVEFESGAWKIASIVFGMVFAAVLWWGAARLGGRVMANREYQLCEALELARNT